MHIHEIVFDGNRLLISTAIENLNNIFYCSVNSTYVTFLVLNFNNHNLLTVALILAFHSTISVSYLHLDHTPNHYQHY